MDPWNTFAHAAGTIGPVGMAFLAAWFLWLRYGYRPKNAQEHTDNLGRLEEMRDLLRDVHAGALRAQEFQGKFADKITEALQRVSESQARIVTVLERLECRMGQHP